MVEALKNDRETRFKDTDDRHILIGAAGSNLTEEEAAEWKQMLVDAFPDSYVYYDPLSFSIRMSYRVERIWNGYQCLFGRL